jgi:hypothetical protein
MLTTGKKTLVLGASGNPGRYSYLAVTRLRGKGHPVVAIGRQRATVGDVEIGTDQQPLTGVDTVTLYLSPLHQQQYYDYILLFIPDASSSIRVQKTRNWPHWHGQMGSNPSRRVRW